MKRVGTVVVLLAAAHVAHGDWKGLAGQEAPEIAVTQWFNQAEGSSLADFRGKAVLLEYWATW
jgi:hypothetical protein